jgi:hypothetical protein
MASTTELPFHVRRPDVPHAQASELPIDSGHGPWPFLAAALSFAIVLLSVIYIAYTSF